MLGNAIFRYLDNLFHFLQNAFTNTANSKAGLSNTTSQEYSMKKLSGAEMVVQSLKDEGVEYVFGYPGGSVLDIYDAIHTLDNIKNVLVRHEQAAIHMADG